LCGVEASTGDVPICVRDRNQVLDGAIAQLALDQGHPGFACSLLVVLGPDQTHIGRAIGQEWHGSWLDNFGHFEGKSWRDCVELMSESFHEAAQAVRTIQAAFTG
jgi:hypothetical protein